MRISRASSKKNTTLLKFVNLWRERGKTIDGLSDLVHCYYISVQVCILSHVTDLVNYDFPTDLLRPKIMRVPGKDRPQLVHDRVKELQTLIAKSCTEAQITRSRAGILLEVEGLQTYMHEAISAFSAELDSPFDFIKTSLLMSHLSTEFSNNILKLMRGVVDV